MTQDSEFVDWVGRYRHAWETNDPEAIAALFTEDATYLTEPYAQPWVGRDEIVREWLENLDPPGSTEFSFEVIATRDDLGIVKGDTVYNDPPREYSNLWEIRLGPEGRCTSFIEWWMKKKES